ncbi:hypothetical protein RCL1_002356 [Eukaryota sp. TZLM3-RCL]
MSLLKSSFSTSYGLFTFPQNVSASSLWIRNLLLDGVVEANPGPPKKFQQPKLDSFLSKSGNLCPTRTSEVSAKPITRSVHSALGTNWLEDETLSNYFNWLHQRLLRTENPRMFYFWPATEVLQWFYGEKPRHGCFNDTSDFLLIVPINDSQLSNKLSDTGTHWSLLLILRNNSSFYSFYANSLTSVDLKDIAETVVLNTGIQSTFTTLKSVQQPDGYNCGVYVCWFMEIVMNYYQSTGTININEIQQLLSQDIPDVDSFRVSLEQINIPMIERPIERESRTKFLQQYMSTRAGIIATSAIKVGKSRTTVKSKASPPKKKSSIIDVSPPAKKSLLVSSTPDKLSVKKRHVSSVKSGITPPVKKSALEPEVTMTVSLPVYGF